MRTGFESTLRLTLLGIEPGTLEIKSEWSDHYTTEAAALQGEKPLVDRTMWVREVRKMDP